MQNTPHSIQSYMQTHIVQLFLHSVCKHSPTPLEKQLDESVGADEGTVCRKKYPPIVLLLTAGIKQVIHHTAQRGCFQSPDFTCTVLNICRAGRRLGCLA